MGEMGEWLVRGAIRHTTFTNEVCYLTWAQFMELQSRDNYNIKGHQSQITITDRTTMKMPEIS